jgi:hypothetical protein
MDSNPTSQWGIIDQPGWTHSGRQQHASFSTTPQNLQWRQGIRVGYLRVVKLRQCL